jgi:chromosome condensin MukBEF ATPase and DNA-binding subunit MukB
MISHEQKQEILRLHNESRPKAEISRLTHISRPKVLEIIKEDMKNKEQKKNNETTAKIVKHSVQGLKSQLTDYERALNVIRDAATDELLGPSVERAIEKNGFVLKESGLGIKLRISSCLDGLKVTDALKILDLLKELINISDVKNEGPEYLKNSNSPIF